MSTTRTGQTGRYSGWTEEMKEEAKALWAQGWSGTQIAEHFGNVFSRSAVIGMMNRLGQPKRGKRLPTPRKKREGTRRTSPRSTKVAPNAAAVLSQSEKIMALFPQPIEEVVIALPVRVTIMELRKQMCRWPLGEPKSPDFRFCGGRATGGSYCPHHAAIAYAPRAA